MLLRQVVFRVLAGILLVLGTSACGPGAGPEYDWEGFSPSAVLLTADELPTGWGPLEGQEFPLISPEAGLADFVAFENAEHTQRLLEVVNVLPDEEFDQLSADAFEAWSAFTTDVVVTEVDVPRAGSLKMTARTPTEVREEKRVHVEGIMFAEDRLVGATLVFYFEDEVPERTAEELAMTLYERVLAELNPDS